MSTALLVTFHEYLHTPRKASSILFDRFIERFAAYSKYVNHWYIVNSNGSLDEQRQERARSTGPCTIWNVPHSSHWANMNLAVPNIKEDKFLLVDSDLIIYEPDVVKQIFEDLDRYEIVTMTDTSGARLYEKYDVLKANQFRDNRHRFTPYLFSCRTELFRRIGQYDFTPDSTYSDSMSKVTDQLLSLDPTIKELPDDRRTLQITRVDPPEGDIKWSIDLIPFLDGPEFEWSARLPSGNYPGGYGYYHTRNWSGGSNLVETRKYDRRSFDQYRKPMPLWEAARLLSWVHIMSDDPSYQQEVVETAEEFGLPEYVFNGYVDDVKALHPFAR